MSIVNGQRRARMIYLGAIQWTQFDVRFFRKYLWLTAAEESLCNKFLSISSGSIHSFEQYRRVLNRFYRKVETHIQRQRPHTHSNFLQPSRNVVYTHLPPTDIWKFKWLKTVYCSARKTDSSLEERGERDRASHYLMVKGWSFV